jgi:hypothetical protein
MHRHTGLAAVGRRASKITRRGGYLKGLELPTSIGPAPLDPQTSSG